MYTSCIYTCSYICLKLDQCLILTFFKAILTSQKLLKNQINVIPIQTKNHNNYWCTKKYMYIPQLSVMSHCIHCWCMYVCRSGQQPNVPRTPVNSYSEHPHNKNQFVGLNNCSVFTVSCVMHINRVSVCTYMYINRVSVCTYMYINNTLLWSAVVYINILGCILFLEIIL